MSNDATTNTPSRRTIAKGAAWAVPAVSVAAVAPTLAASTEACAPGTLVVEPVCPDTTVDLIDGEPLYFTITNPSESGCVVPEGTEITVDRGGLADVKVLTLNELANVGVFYTGSDTAELTSDLEPGSTAVIRLFPQDLATVSALTTATVSVAGSSASQDYTIVNIPLTGTTIAVCGRLIDL